VEILSVSRQGFEDRLEGICAFEACGVDGYSDVRLGLRGPLDDVDGLSSTASKCQGVVAGAPHSGDRQLSESASI
jgi:hypothetical protein